MHRFIIILVILTCSCKDSKTTYDKSIITLSIDMDDLQKEQDLSNILLLKNKIDIKTDTNYLIGQLNKVELYDSNIYLFSKGNNGGVFAFDQRGEFLYSIDKRGRGPGEFTLITDFLVDKENMELNILDLALKQILIFDLDGKYISSLNLPDSYLHFEKFKNDYYLVRSKPSDVESGYYATIWNKDKGIIDEKFPFSNNRNGNFSLTHHLYRNMAEVLHWEPFNDTIYSYNFMGKNKKYFINFGDRKLPDQIWEMDNAEKVNFFTSSDNNLLFINDVTRFKDFMSFNFIAKDGKTKVKKINAIWNLNSGESQIFSSFIVNNIEYENIYSSISKDILVSIEEKDIDGEFTLYFFQIK